MVMMAAKILVDTNILLRAYHSAFVDHERIRSLFDRMLDEDQELWISRQVIREYLVQVTHPRTFAEPLSIHSALEQLEGITRILHIADETAQVTAQLFALLKDHPTAGKQIHDANIVATMLAYDIDALLTLNADDFKRFERKIKIVLPDSPH
jgi:predicted nucleic acid-binding protein